MRTSTFPILLITSNVKPRVAPSVPFRQCARPNFNPDITDWQQRPVARSDGPPVTDTCRVLSWPSEKASNAMLKLHQHLNKIVEMLAIQRKKSSLTQPVKSLFSMMTVWSMNPFKQLSGPMFGESPRLTSSLISNLDFSHSWKQQFILKSHLKSHPMYFKKSSNKLTCYSSISFFCFVFVFLLLLELKKRCYISWLKLIGNEA